MLQLLELAIRYGFPRLPDDPDAGILAFESSFDAFQIEHGGQRYRIQRQRQIAIDVGGANWFTADFGLDARWTYRQTNAILATASEAIRSGTAPRGSSDLRAAPGVPGGPRTDDRAAGRVQARPRRAGRAAARLRTMARSLGALPGVSGPAAAGGGRASGRDACGVPSMSCQVVACR